MLYLTSLQLPAKHTKCFRNLQNGFENATMPLSHSVNQIPTMPSTTLDKLPRLRVANRWMPHKVGKKLFPSYKVPIIHDFTQLFFDSHSINPFLINFINCLFLKLDCFYKTNFIVYLNGFYHRFTSFIRFDVSNFFINLY